MGSYDACTMAEWICILSRSALTAEDPSLGCDFDSQSAIQVHELWSLISRNNRKQGYLVAMFVRARVKSPILHNFYNLCLKTYVSSHI